MHNEPGFDGITPEQRVTAALKLIPGAVLHVTRFMAATDPAGQRAAVEDALAALQGLLKLLCLDHLMAARALHALGPYPPDDAPEDAGNLRAIRELHLVLDWLGEVCGSDAIDVARADLRRLAEGQRPRALVREHYVDARIRDFTELHDRRFLVLFVNYLIAKDGLTLPELLAGLGIGEARFESWASAVDLDQRELMAEAGRLEREGMGLSPEQLARLSPVASRVLARDMLEGLAGLDDYETLRRLAARAKREAPR